MKISNTYGAEVPLKRDEVNSFDTCPFSLAAVRPLETRELHPAVPFFAGENGSGKPTLLEAIAVACGFNHHTGLNSAGFPFTLASMSTGKHRSIVPHRHIFYTAILSGVLAYSAALGAETETLTPPPAKTITVLPLDKSASRGVVTRDPSSIVKCKDDYWMFYTGKGVPSYHSKDLEKWERGPAVFTSAPEWVAKIVPENRNMVYWAPDIIKIGDRYLLYYSVSTIGKMTSAIGLATNPTLDPADPAYRWTDQGFVVRTKEGSGYNAIDPALFQDNDGSLWMTFGSYWSGIKLLQLDPGTGKRLAPDSQLSSLAYNDSIEAGYLCKHDDNYYLFVNWGSCCRGPESTYNIRIGRSKTITGPYKDKAGVDMMQRGGSVFLATTNGPLIGPGHAGTLDAKGKKWFTSDFEGDLRMQGRATLAIMPLRWNADGWPEAIVNDVKK